MRIWAKRRLSPKAVIQIAKKRPNRMSAFGQKRALVNSPRRVDGNLFVATHLFVKQDSLGSRPPDLAFQRLDGRENLVINHDLFHTIQHRVSRIRRHG